MASIEGTRLKELRQARTVLISVLAINLSLSVMKLLVGMYTGTLSIAAEGFHSLLDTAANAVAVIGLSFSLKPPDKEHPYGHKKYEALSAIAISFFMFLASFEIGQEIVHRLLSPEAAGPKVGFISYAVIITTLVANFLTCKWEQKKGKDLNCSILLADSAHTMSDVWASLAVLSTLVGIQLHFGALDMICSGAIVLFILKAGYSIVVSQIGTLVDEVVLDPRKIEELVRDVPGVAGCHKVRSRGTADHVFVDLHVQVSSEIRIQDAHSISFEVEEKLKATYGGIVEVLVHLEDNEPPVSC